MIFVFVTKDASLILQKWADYFSIPTGSLRMFENDWSQWSLKRLKDYVFDTTLPT